jgi:hypothetical protein
MGEASRVAGWSGLKRAKIRRILCTIGQKWAVLGAGGVLKKQTQFGFVSIYLQNWSHG